MAEYKLPDVGEGLTEAEIVSWKVQEGDQVAVNDVICEIETAKSIVELPSPFAGTVARILVAEGEMVPVGTPIIDIGGQDGPAAGAEEQRAVEDEATREEAAIDLSNPASSGGGEGESLVGRMKADRGAIRRARRRPGAEVAGDLTARADVMDTFNRGAPSQHETVSSIVDNLLTDSAAQASAAGVPQDGQASGPVRGGDPAGRQAAGDRPLAKPPVRKLAKDLGVDLATLAGSGPQGSITRDDVQEAAGRGGAMPERYEDLDRPGVAPTGTARETREPVKGVRKMMAQAMSASAFTAPHVTEWITVDVTRTTELVRRLREGRDLGDFKVSPLLVLAKACLLAMRRTPEINSTFDEAAQEVVYKGYVNLGIAAATPRGLVVPNVKDADAMTLRELAQALSDLTAKAREGRTQPEEMSGGTFTITNVGVFGIDAGTPIINPGESAILAFGATTRRPWVVGDGAEERIEVRDVCTLALSFDHRHIDGRTGSQFLADVAAIMSDPATALLY